MIYKISSKDRTTGTSSNFSMRLDNGIDELDGSYKCTMISLPVYWYNVSNDSKDIPFSVGGNDWNCELKVGNYTSELLVSSITSGMNALGHGFVFSCALDALSGKLAISCNSPFTLKLKEADIAKVMGFKKADIVSVDNKVIGDYVVNFNPVNAVNINIEGIGNSVIQSNGFNCCVMCPIKEPLMWGVNVYEFEHPIVLEFRKVRDLKVKVINSDTGRVLDLNGADWFFVLEHI